MPDDSPLVPTAATKTSTVANLLGKAQSSLANAFTSSTSSSLAAGGSASSSSFLTSPLLWVGVVLAGAAVWFVKFKKPARKSVKFRR